MNECLYLIREPYGSTYRELIDLACTCCSSFSLVWRQSPGLQSDDEIHQTCKRFLEKEEMTDSWPGTKLGDDQALVRTYSLTEETASYLKEVAGLYSWQAPVRPEDLAFYTADDEVWMASTSHEDAAYFPGRISREQLLNAIPSLFLYEDEGPPDGTLSYLERIRQYEILVVSDEASRYPTSQIMREGDRTRLYFNATYYSFENKIWSVVRTLQERGLTILEINLRKGALPFSEVMSTLDLESLSPTDFQASFMKAMVRSYKQAGIPAKMITADGNDFIVVTAKQHVNSWRRRIEDDGDGSVLTYLRTDDDDNDGIEEEHEIEELRGLLYSDVAYEFSEDEKDDIVLLSFAVSCYMPCREALSDDELQEVKLIREQLGVLVEPDRIRCTGLRDEAVMVALMKSCEL